MILGRYTTSEYDGMVYDSKTGNRIDLRGKPAVSVDMNGGRSGVRTFMEPFALRSLADELLSAANWLESQIQFPEVFGQ